MAGGYVRVKVRVRRIGRPGGRFDVRPSVLASESHIGRPTDDGQRLMRMSALRTQRPFLFVPSPFLFLVLLLFQAPTHHALLYYGCSLSDSLCDRDERCVPDGLLGECSTPDHRPLIVRQPLDPLQNELLRLEILRLNANGYQLEDYQSQCVLVYFKFSIALNLQYDPDFCAVRNPRNVLALLHIVRSKITEPQTEDALEDRTKVDTLFDYGTREGFAQLLADNNRNDVISDDNEEHKNNDDDEIPLTVDEENRLRGFLSDFLNDRTPDLSILNEKELHHLSKYVQFLKDVFGRSQNAIRSRDTGEVEEAIPLNGVNDEALPLKKDTEHVGEQNTGLDKIEHKIVKGTGIQKVESNRVYLRVPEKLNEDQLKHLIEYIDHYIAKPNKIIIDEFMWDNGQLSFRVSRPEIIRLRHDKRIESAEGIAEAVYKRRKDIETMSGVRVDETGIGSGKGVIPVESEERDWLFAPILLICSLTIAALLSVLAVHFTRQYRRNRRSLLHPDLAERVDGKASVVYEELCRQRMSGAQEQPPTNGTTSKHSSTSSWGEEPVAQPTLDISTGHVLLTYLKQYLQNSSKIEEEWASLVNYTNPKGTTEIAGREENKQKNRNPLVLPYDETLVTLKTIDIDATKSNYINASSIYDSDPRQPLYIATQSPLPNTTADFWQMIWEQGCVLIVNLANEDDLKEGNCSRYWSEGSPVVSGKLEIHLVSEHIWSEDYFVRSLYLKNLATNETRTITQFHFLTWPDKGVPATTKSLLEFRRKINKSYRGRGTPIIVHCTDGAGRTGTYCLLDMVLNRITKGVKELNIAASFEHLRDQRMNMVETQEQYNLVLNCVAEEVNAMVQALPR